MQRTFLGFLPAISQRLLPITASCKSFERAGRFFLLAVATSLSVSNAGAQAVWTNADDRDYSGTPPVFSAAFWSYGYVAPDSNGNGGHVGNWSGNPVPGVAADGSFSGPVDVYLGTPGDTLCDVQVTLNSLTFAAGGGLNLDFGSALTVTTTTLATDGTMTEGGGGGAYPAYTNTGTLTKTAGTGTFTFAGGITLGSTPGSTIAVASGSLQLPGQDGLFDTVTFTPAAGTVIDLVSGDSSGAEVNLFQGTLTNGAGSTGSVLLDQGTMAGTQHFLDSSLVTACTLAFTGNVFQWTGGVIGTYQQGAVFTNTGVVNVVGDNTPTLYANFTNAGQMIQTGAGGLAIGNYNSGGTVTNAAGGVIDLQSDAGIGYGGGNGNFLTNAGLLKKSGGTATSTINTNLTFNNTGGTVEADSGTLQLSGNGTSTGGTYNAAAGALLDLGSGNFSGTYTGSGAGTVRLTGKLTAEAPGMTLAFQGTLFQWIGGQIDGDNSTSPVVSTGTVNLSGDAKKLNTSSFTNNGTVVETGTGTFQTGYYNGGGNFTNAVGAVFDLQSDAGVSGDYNNTFTNAGLLEKTAGTGTSTFIGADTGGPPFVNTGTVSVYSGTLSFADGINDISNTTLTEGTWNVFDGASLTLLGNTSGITINQANVTLSGANASFPAINQLSDNQGSFSLLALQQFSTVGALSNEGSLALDAGTTLHVAGAFTASGTNSSLAITVGGTATQGALSPGILQVNGVATVAGNLAVSLASSATLPATTDTLTVVAATAPIAGNFANAANGARINTADGKGSFLVTYGTGSASPNAVTLSQFLLPGVSPVTALTISLTASVASANANEGVDGSFLLTLSAAQSTDIFVNLQIKGTAINGADYTLLKTTKKIKAGKTSKPINVIPVDESFYAGGKKTVKITLLPGTGYTVGGTTTAKVKIFYDR